MRLRRFQIRNFKGLKDVSFEWERFVVLIGENNTGKSSVLHALESFLSGSPIKDLKLCRNHVAPEEEPVELIGYFVDLSSTERSASAVAGRMLDSEWVLKKSFWCDGNGVWKEMYYSLAQPEHFVGWPESTGSWTSFSADYQPFIEKLEDRGSRPSQATLEQLKSVVRSERPDLIEKLDATWMPNPGGGGNWKSNANSILPRAIFIHAVQEAAAEATSKDASSYGKIISLIVERKMMAKPEILKLRQHMGVVLKLFSPDPEHPEEQAPEIREIQATINAHLNQVVGGSVRITTRDPDIQPFFLPNTTLMMKADGAAVETIVEHQGHGLQRTLIITLLQVLATIQNEAEAKREEDKPRATIFMIEEPELYLHPQMERKMRDALYRVSDQDQTQVIACTHSPVFLDMGQRHASIVRVVNDNGSITFKQVTEDIFDAVDADVAKERLKFLSEFQAGVNEVFFARRVVLVEGRTEIAAFDYAAQKMGLFARHPAIRRDVSIIECGSKSNIPLFEKVLNHFNIPYLALYDEDHGAEAMTENQMIDDTAAAGGEHNRTERVVPRDLETLLNYGAGRNKPYRAIKRIELLCNGAGLPPEFVRLLNQVYFRENSEPA